MSVHTLRSSDVIAAIRLLAAQGRPVTAHEGTVVPDSYNAQTNEVDFLVGDTAGIDDSDPSQEPLVLQGVPLCVTAPGFQAGPLGGERGLAFHAGEVSGVPFWRVILDSSDDDSPGAPAGEVWQDHRTNGITDPTPNAGWKLTNDGENPGDRKGGFRAFGAFISLVAGLIMIGAEGLLKPNRGAMVRDDGDALAANILQAVSEWAALHVQPGSGAPPIEQTVHATASKSVFIAP